MATTAEWFKVEDGRTAQVLQDAADKLDSADGNLVLDLSSLRRIDPAALRGLEEFVNQADAKSVKVTLRGVNVDVYKVLKLMKLAARFSFCGLKPESPE